MDTLVCVKACICLFVGSYLFLNVLSLNVSLGHKCKYLPPPCTRGFISLVVRGNPEASFSLHIILPFQQFQGEGRGHEHGL